MILSARKIFTKEQKPAFNELGFVPSTPFDSTQPFSYTNLINLIKRTPEAIGILNAIKTDICSDGFSFEGPKVRVERTQKFLKDNRFKSQFGGTVIDWLMLGNGALWKGKISEKRIKEVIDKLQITTGIQYKEIEVKAMSDEDVFSTKLIKHAPWSTMHIDLSADMTNVRQFRQVLSAGKTTTFKPEEIIHGKFMEFDGKVYGFSPMEASVNVISTLSLIKDLNGNFFNNGGVPDWMFILPKEMSGSPNVRKLEQTLRKYRSARNKHGNLVFTGEVEAKQLNQFDKDMEFRQLAVYYTGILALAFNMPMARVAAIIGGDVKSGTAGTDLSEAGYWRSISSAQDYWEDLLNQQMFEPDFGVEIRFNRGYKNDEIKEAQRDVQLFEVLNKLAQSKSIKPEYIKKKLHIPDKYWTGKFEPVEATSPFGGAGGAPGSSPNNVKKGDAQNASADRKKEEAKKTMERKETDSYTVDLSEFMRLFERWVKTSDTRKVDYYIEGDNYIMYIATPDSTYRLAIGKSKLSEVQLNDILSFGRRVHG